MEYDFRHTIHLLAYALGLSENQTRETNMFVWAMTMTIDLGANQIRASIVVVSMEDSLSSCVVFILRFLASFDYLE